MKPKKIRLSLTKSQFSALVFATRNYKHILETEIKHPTREHGPAESVMALLEVNELIEVVNKAGAQ